MYVGTPNGAGIELYRGETVVFNIPQSASPNEVANLLAGDNLDIAVSGGPDAEVEVAGSLGVSLDMNPAGGYQHTHAGQMFALEHNTSIGLGMIPTALNAGIEIGTSHTDAGIIFQMPWWP